MRFGFDDHVFPHAVVLQPSVSGMEPPFGDAFQNYSFVDQALTSTELLATSSDPDFMYELVSGHTHAHSQETELINQSRRMALPLCLNKKSIFPPLHI